MIILMLVVISGCSSIGPAAVHDTAAHEPATAQVQTSTAQPPKTLYQAALAELTSEDVGLEFLGPKAKH